MGIVLFGLVLVLEVGNVLIYNYINFYINEVYLLFYIVINFFFFLVMGFLMFYFILIVVVVFVIYILIVRYFVFCFMDKIF